MNNKLNLINEIKELKKEKNAIILAHHYQIEEIQNIADIIGDSLALSKAAVNVKENVIVFCGVHFMAETAKILSPHKKVLLPVKNAGCPMADMITAESLRKKKKQYPNAVVVCYVNSPAEVKAESDVCCTSSNAIEVVRKIPEKQILFVPDQNLGTYVKSQVPDKDIILWDGYCITHHCIKKDEALKVKLSKPNAKILVHPECRPDLVSIAHFVGSTSQIINYVNNSDDNEFIIGTEMGILTALYKKHPNKKFYMLSPKLICSDMKKTRLEDLKNTLLNDTYEIDVPIDIREKALLSLDRMLK